MEKIVSKMNIRFYILGFILALGGIYVEAGDYCTYRYSCYNYLGTYSYCYQQTYCDYGCCGTSYNEACSISVEAGDYCTYRYSCCIYSGTCYQQTYCDYGCCGTSYSEACCTYNASGVIAGSVIGSLIGFGLVIALIVYCCVAVSKSGTHRGVVVQPANTTQIHTLAVTNTAVASGPSSYPDHYGPVMYGNPAAHQAPPPYIGTSRTNCASYPPPPPIY